jgi:protoheme IX farnesyltransferase
MTVGVATRTQQLERTQASRPRLSDYFELTKPRICGLVLVTTAIGFFLGAGPIDPLRFAATLLGTALVGGGASALNHLLERKVDALMRRTENRPLPTGRLHPAEVAIFGVVLSALGVIMLFVRVNPLTGVLGVIALVSYVLVYTPLKRVTSLNTHVGAIPGALPAVMGFTASQGHFGLAAWVLFSIMFLWQLPHFLAIAWLYRDDYRRAGFPMLTVVDADGSATGRQVVLYTLSLIVVSLMPSLLGMAGALYFFLALVLGLGFLACGVALARRKTAASARHLLLASVVYLPLLLSALMLDRV